MSLPWVRLDTAFPVNPKVLALVEDRRWRAGFAYVCGLAVAGAQGTDGWLSPTTLPHTHGTTRDAEALVDVGLWVPTMTGWSINGWEDYQPSNREQQDRRARAQAAANLRWARQRGDI